MYKNNSPLKQLKGPVSDYLPELYKIAATNKLHLASLKNLEKCVSIYLMAKKVTGVSYKKRDLIGAPSYSLNLCIGFVFRQNKDLDPKNEDHINTAKREIVNCINLN
jgi:hypothetical protein